MNKKGVLSFSGGKDCHLSLLKAIEKGIEITHLVIFSNQKTPKFLGHPFEIIKLQSEALKIPYLILEIKEPYLESYVESLIYLHENYETEIIVTGDMDFVSGTTDWMTQCCEKTDGKIKVFQPLWKMNRMEVLDSLSKNNIKTIISCAKPPFDSSWVGKEMNSDVIKKLEEFSIKNKIDVCGEEGHYHTMVVNFPLYSKEISVDNFEIKETVKNSSTLYHLSKL